ncbi:four helix bundle protein [Desulfosarcina sp.]|uniref:four helix bundle protein n=1 Tax=Desulfosarcina sp. TaxID=2027861 RepID=UPI0039B87268
MTKNGSVCELETQILIAGDLDLIEKCELGTLKKDLSEIERMLKALIKSLKNKPLAQTDHPYYIVNK